MLLTGSGAPDSDDVAFACLRQHICVPGGGQDVGQEQVLLVGVLLRHLDQVDIGCIVQTNEQSAPVRPLSNVAARQWGGTVTRRTSDDARRLNSDVEDMLINCHVQY